MTTEDRSDEYKAFHAAENGGFVLTRLSDVKPERVQWLWSGRIPVGKLVTLDGDPGLGKSTLALEIAATITTGGVWPDGGGCEQPGAVLLLSAEDGLADTVRPRLDAAGADVTQVHAIEGVPTVSRDGEITLRPPTLADVHSLELAVVDTGARLVIVDVIMSFLPSGTDSHRDQDVRAVLGRLAGLADRTGCSVLLLRHLNKASGRDPLYRGGGSIGIVGAARSGLLVAADPDDPERRVLASVKSNLGPPPESLAYRLVGTDMGVARVQWEGSTGHSAADLLRPRDSDDEDGAKSEAERWLSDYMAEQVEVSSKTAKADAAKVGIKERTLQRVAHMLGLRIESRGFPRVTWWVLPSRDSSPSNKNLGATGATGAEQHKHNGATGPKTQSRQAPCDGATEQPELPTVDDGPQLSGDDAIVYFHSSVFGVSQKPVRKFTVGKPKPYAQYPVSVNVSFVEPKKRSWLYVTATPNSPQFVTVEADGKTVYDSRQDVPIDMDHWHDTYRQHVGGEA